MTTSGLFQDIHDQLAKLEAAVNTPAEFTRRLCNFLNDTRTWANRPMLEAARLEAAHTLEALRVRLAKSGKVRGEAAAREIKRLREDSAYTWVPLEDDRDEADYFRGLRDPTPGERD
jgi:hypothetical protein